MFSNGGFIQTMTRKKYTQEEINEWMIDAAFWDMIRKANVKSNMSQSILTDSKHLYDNKISLAEELAAEAYETNRQAWIHLFKINNIDVANGTPNISVDIFAKRIFLKSELS